MKLTIKQKFELMYDRYMNYFHHQEKRSLTYYSHFFGDKLLQIEEDGLQVSVENFDKRYVNSFWQYSSFGSMFELYEEISEYINGDVDRYRLLLKKVSPHCYSFKRVYKGSLKDTELEAPDICGLTKLFKVGSLHRTTINAIRGHINQPLFEKGSIVNLRSNCGVDAVVKPRKMSYGNTYRYEGVGTSIYYPQPVPRMSYYKNKYGYDESKYSVAAQISDSIISFPVGPHLGLNDMEIIASEFKKIMEK